MKEKPLKAEIKTTTTPAAPKRAPISFPAPDVQNKSAPALPTPSSAAANITWFSTDVKFIVYLLLSGLTGCEADNLTLERRNRSHKALLEVSSRRAFGGYRALALNIDVALDG
jgi:hypothetical protein